MWSIAATFATCITQFKAATYAHEREMAADLTKFPWIAYYDREALQSLEITHAMNFVVFLGYYVYVFPQTWEMWKASVVDEVYGENDTS